MNLIGIQLDIAWKDKHANFARVRRLLTEAGVEPGSFVVLPEMFASGFSMDGRAIAEPADGETTQFLSGLAREFGIGVMGGVVCMDADGAPRNQTVAMDREGNEIARFTKLYPFSLTHEQCVYRPGRAVCVFPWDDFRIAPFICYDLRFPEAFRDAVRKGATLLIAVANWPDVREVHWTTLLRARAIENQAYVLGVNRCGSDPKQRYPGRSLIISPRGTILADGGRHEGVVRARVDLAALEEYREAFPAVRDMQNRGDQA